jgi:hypothetical protein
MDILYIRTKKIKPSIHPSIHINDMVLFSIETTVHIHLFISRGTVQQYVLQYSRVLCNVL